jgi:ubiquinone/menaquinone biosynthesis C-methylase UbiE
MMNSEERLMNSIPDWQLPSGVDRGLWDYLHSAEMVATYDEQMRASPLAAEDMAFCEKTFSVPGRLLDLGCGTGRLCVHFASRGFDCVGVDLSEEMLAKAQENRKAAEQRGSVSFVKGNLVDLTEIPPASFDYAACLFSTLGMIDGNENRAKVVDNAFRVLKPGGRFVLHVHNRYFYGLGWRTVLGQAAKSWFGQAGDIQMPQAYGGAPLTLHHFTRREAVNLLQQSGFEVREVFAVDSKGKAAWPRWKVYGWLMLAERKSPLP